LTDARAGKPCPVIEVCHEGGGRSSAVVVVELTRDSTRDLARVLRRTVSAGDVRVIVDLGERLDVSSDLLAILHRTARQLRGLGGRLAVVTAQPDLRRLFDVTLLSQAFGVFTSRDEALQSWT
jgi:anti-anti-sigma regulatory factor